ncbi:uncharacterized protein LOC131670083 [Phymastichus coffea]|uniref:uncharacterized protein LOC131670083 n=1 Tax=Phymastichus coffea TaxID=108790 RepID=UPI00273CCDAF|nr:uncharacterized protein LOC131670083 [Phymastichus coffea]
MSPPKISIGGPSSDSVIERINSNSSHFRWKIKKFTEINKTADVCVRSPRITATCCKVEWCLHFYPNGVRSGKGDMAVSVEYFSEASNVPVILEISFENAKRQILENYTVRREIVISMRNHPENKGSPRSPSKLSKSPVTFDYFPAKRQVIENPENESPILTRGGCLSISFKVIYNDHLFAKKTSREVANLKNVIEFEKIFDKGHFNDVIFFINNNIEPEKQIVAHRAILSHRSQVFLDMFARDVHENKASIVTVSNCSYQVMLELVRFAYTDYVREIDDIVCELYKAAHMYSIVDLLAVCESCIVRTLNVNNAIECLMVADHCKVDELKNHVLKFVVDNISNIVHKTNFPLLSSPIICEIMRCVIPRT